MRVLRFVSIGLVLAGLAFAAGTYGALPERIPAKLDFSRQVTRFTEKSPLGWFGLPLLNAALLAMILFISSRLPARPHWFNFPEKARFLALPPRYQAPVIEEMRLMLEVAALGVVLTLVAVQALLWRTASGERAGALALAPFVGLLLTPVLLLFVLRVQSATEREEKRWRAEAPGPDERGSPLPHAAPLAPPPRGT